MSIPIDSIINILMIIIYAILINKVLIKPNSFENRKKYFIFYLIPIIALLFNMAFGTI